MVAVYGVRCHCFACILQLVALQRLESKRCLHPNPCPLPLQLVLDCFPQQQQALLAQLGAHPDQQFAFLKSLVAIHQRQQAAEGAGGAEAGGSLKVGGIGMYKAGRAACLAPTCVVQ